MYNEGFVAHVDDSADTVAGVESSCGTGIVLHSSVIVAVLDILKNFVKFTAFLFLHNIRNILL